MTLFLPLLIQSSITSTAKLPVSHLASFIKHLLAVFGTAGGGQHIGDSGPILKGHMVSQGRTRVKTYKHFWVKASDIRNTGRRRIQYTLSFYALLPPCSERLSYVKQDVDFFLPSIRFQRGIAFLLCYMSATWM